MVKCHCGNLVVANKVDEVPDSMNPSLALNYCDECALVRCDAYPGACWGEEDRY